MPNPSKACATRLTRELRAFRSAPPPLAPSVYVDEKDLLEWFILLQGAPDSPYEGGWYVMRIKFKHDYPFKAPAVSMITPNGRFAENQSVCMSMTEVRSGDDGRRDGDRATTTRARGVSEGLTMDDFGASSMMQWHQESWNPAWSASCIVTGFISFMTTDEQTSGGVRTTDAEKRRLAAASLEWNAKNANLVQKFPELADPEKLHALKMK